MVVLCLWHQRRERYHERERESPSPWRRPPVVPDVACPRPSRNSVSAVPLSRKVDRNWPSGPKERFCCSALGPPAGKDSPMLGEAVALHLGQVETSPNTWRERERQGPPCTGCLWAPSSPRERERERYPNRATTRAACLCAIVRWMDGWFPAMRYVGSVPETRERERERPKGTSE